ncbi:MAG: hypothetical protein ACE5E1_03565, partial [Phycisphaerae bacterium]
MKESSRRRMCSILARTGRTARDAGTVGRPRRRRGYVLLLVLGIAAIVTSLGIAFLEANSTVMPEAANQFYGIRAQYLAESGVDIGTHFLMYPPTTVAPDSFWPGAAGIAIDATSDFTDISVIQDALDPERFVVTAVGVAHDPAGAVRGKRTITADVIRPVNNKWQIPYGLLGGTMIVPATVTVQGDIHANGMLTGLGSCQGNVSAVGVATWTGSGPPASVTSGATPFTPPAPNPLVYGSYTINGTTYTAYAYAQAMMTSLDADALNAIDMSATNPGRIIIAPPGDFSLDSNAALNGTLVVNGNLSLCGGATVTAV